MSSSGLIYAVIVGAWAAYLVPMWLRRQDELNEARPTERFSTAIRLLSGRAAMERKISRQLEETQALNPPADPPAKPSARGVDASPRPAVTPSAAPAPAATAPAGGTASRRRAALLARRRRMVMVLFAAFTVGMVVAAVGGVALLWIPAVPAVLFSLYIAQMRRQERRRYEVKLDHRLAAEAAQRVRQQAASRRGHERAAQEAETVAYPAPSAPHAPHTPSARAARPAAAPEEPTTSGTGALTASAGAAGAAGAAQVATPEPWADDDRPEHASPSTGRPGDDAWNPVPVPLPTYVTAPVAPRATLGLDLSAPDTYSSARAPRAPRPSDQPPVPPRRPVQPPATPLFDQYADDTPRAANE